MIGHLLVIVQVMLFSDIEDIVNLSRTSDQNTRDNPEAERINVFKGWVHDF